MFQVIAYSASYVQFGAHFGGWREQPKFQSGGNAGLLRSPTSRHDSADVLGIHNDGLLCHVRNVCHRLLPREKKEANKRRCDVRKQRGLLSSAALPVAWSGTLLNSTALVFWTGGPQSRQKGTSSLGDPSLGSVREVFRLLKSQHHEMMSSLLFSPKCNSDNNRWKQFRQSRLFQRMPKKRVFYFQSKIAAEVPAKSHICSANVRSILFSDSLKKGAYSEARKI